MTEPPTDAQVAELEAVYAAGRKKTASLKRTQTLLSLALAAVIVAALFMIYDRAAGQYTREHFEPAVRAEWEILQPDIQDEAEALVDQVYPVYRDLARERIEHMGPELREMAEAELFGLTDRLRDAAERQLSDSLARLEARHVQRLQDHFPELEDPVRRDDIKHEFIAGMESETVELLGGFHERVMYDLQNIGATIEAFRPNRFEEMERNALLRTYMHLWLMLADYEVMAFDGKLEEDSDG
jgi:hypothetical protein